MGQPGAGPLAPVALTAGSRHRHRPPFSRETCSPFIWFSANQLSPGPAPPSAPQRRPPDIVRAMEAPLPFLLSREGSI